MVIDYAKGYDVTPEDMIKSLRDNVQLALDEQQMQIKRQTVELLDSVGLHVSEAMASISDLEYQTDYDSDELGDTLRASQNDIVDLWKAILTEFEIDVEALNLDSLDFKDKVKAIKTAFIPKLKAVLKDVKDLKENYTALEARVSALEE